MRQQPRNVVVIGASRGIGLEIANHLSGDFQVLAFSRSPKPKELIQNITYFQADISDQMSVESVIALHTPNNLHGIVFVSGISISSEGNEIHRFSKTIDVNLVGAFRVISALQSKLEQGSSIVCVSSINAHLAFPNNPGYVASKAGLEGLVRALSLDLNQIPCRVNAISLGYFLTEMTKSSFNYEQTRIQRASRTILGRWGELSEISSVVHFLLSDSSSYITGQSIVVDGGWTVKGM